ncbi:hypothetical protein [Streptomyces sp. NPDC048659]|uniref:hypothetical protein n=1 Tax=Streptomyces sp. NPDC048659 TaxID=3155489 RepID=UPI00342E4B23
MRIPRVFGRRPQPAAPALPPEPLHDPTVHTPAAPLPLDAALRIARDALARHQGANIHSRIALYFAAVDLDHALRTLVHTVDHEQGA